MENKTIYTLENLREALEMHRVGGYMLEVVHNRGGYALINITFTRTLNPWRIMRRRRCEDYINVNKIIAITIDYD